MNNEYLQRLCYELNNDKGNRMILKKILALVDYAPAIGNETGFCAVCGSKTDLGHKFTKLFTRSSFNLNHDFKKPESNVVCEYCTVFFSKENWAKYCDETGHDRYFPMVEGKKPFLANWVFFSHYFAENDHRIVKKRQDWRGYLTNPPPPPFCFVLSAICKKHLLYKAEMAYNNIKFPIRFEDKIIQIDVVNFRECLDSFEALYSVGLNKASLVTGDYNVTAMLKVDRELLHKHDYILEKFRRNNIDYLKVCEFIGAKDA